MRQAGGFGPRSAGPVAGMLVRDGSFEAELVEIPERSLLLIALLPEASSISGRGHTDTARLFDDLVSEGK